ncbi:glycosyltransferase family 4 protein [Candidatus Kuenenbacteria bacterium]|nr:glycosyltransferase family 4 protein [Candidatus Kuenenbacteria bacterium]
MLIGIDASRANKPKKTGVEWYSYHLIEELKKIDKENHYFLYTDKPLQGNLANCPDNFEERVLKWWLPRFWTLGRLSWEMKFGKRIPDVLFVPAHTIPLLNPKKVVVTVHDIGFEHFPKLYHWADKLYHRFTIRFIKKHADQIITVSNYSKEDICQFYKIAEDKVKVILNGFNNKQYKPIENLEKKIDQPYMLFIGRLEEKKNTARLVEAFGKFKQKNPDDKHKLVLIGKKGFGFEKVEENINKYNLQNQVVFPGWVEDKELPIWLNGADLFIFPSLFEGFGIPVLEAMATGCPVICSKTTSLPEVAGEAALMFNPENVDEIVSRIEQVLLNPEVQESLKIKGFSHVKNFSWEKCAIETLEIISNLASL